MASHKTENLKLHSWERTDAFLMDEFNENFTKIDVAVAGKAEQTNLAALSTQLSALNAGKANQTDLETLTAQLSALDTKKANQTDLETLTAQLSALDPKKANKTDLDTEIAARKSADVTLSGQIAALEANRLRYKADSYTGTGAATVRLTFDFKPLLLIVSAKNNYYYGGYPWVRGLMRGRTYMDSTSYCLVPITWENRAVQWNNSINPQAAEFWLNDTNTAYCYLAIGIVE